MEVYRTPEERFENLPGYAFAPHWFEYDGLRMHYLDEGSGHPILLLHGEPTWSFLYRRMIPPLVAAGHRVIAPDYIGFGKSDKPIGLDWYTYENHVSSIGALVEALDLREATMVVQDWGGPIGLKVATDMDDRFARLVILNTGIYSGRGNRMPEAWWAFHDFVKRVTPDVPVGMLISRACFTEPSPEVMAGYEAPFPVPEAKWGVSAFPALVPTGPDTPGAAEMQAASERLNQWEKPALVCFSDSDFVFTPRIGERLAERIPGAGPLVVIEKAAHFLQEDQGEEIAGHIVQFLR
jgi:haloalkane dehalogenase